jgi:hypothetical protein
MQPGHEGLGEGRLVTHYAIGCHCSDLSKNPVNAYLQRPLSLASNIQ